MFAEAQPASFKGGVCQQHPRAAGGEWGRVRPCLAPRWFLTLLTRKNLQAIPALKIYFFPFQGHASLKPPLAVDHFSCWQSSAGRCSLHRGAGHHHPKCALSPGWGSPVAWGESVKEGPDHVCFSLVRAHSW